MEAVLDKKDRESLNILYKFNAENIRKIDELKRTIQTWEVGEISGGVRGINENILVNKVKKYKTDEPLMKLISEIINNTVLGNKEKQIAIEKLCLDYDLNWF